VTCGNAGSGPFHHPAIRLALTGPVAVRLQLRTPQAFWSSSGRVDPDRLAGRGDDRRGCTSVARWWGRRQRGIVSRPEDILRPLTAEQPGAPGGEGSVTASERRRQSGRGATAGEAADEGAGAFSKSGSNRFRIEGWIRGPSISSWRTQRNSRLSLSYLQ